MNVKLVLTLGVTLLVAFGMKDTLMTGTDLILGRADVISNGGERHIAITRPAPPKEGEVDRWQKESDRRVQLWRDCGREDYKETHRDECDRLLSSVD
jgi:hypothetical protein